MNRPEAFETAEHDPTDYYPGCQRYWLFNTLRDTDNRRWLRITRVNAYWARAYVTWANAYALRYEPWREVETAIYRTPHRGEYEVYIQMLQRPENPC